MKTLADLNEIEFLRQTNKIRKAVAEPLKKLNIVGVLKTPAIFENNATKEEKAEASRAQAKQNINKIMDIMLEEQPEETIELLHLLIIPEEGEEINGVKLLSAAANLLSNKDILDFLSSLTQLVVTNTAS